MQSPSCSICASSQTGWEFQSPEMSVWLCEQCGHRCALHSVAAPTSDYYEHTPTNSKYVASLLETRKRQAAAVLDRLVPLLDESDGWLDFGCGRGQFLQEAKAHGLENLGGYETSALSKEWLSKRGFPMAESKAGESFWPNWESLPFAPKVVSLFDVLEHFPVDQALPAVERILRELPDLKWLVIKVPVSNGILFRIARMVKGFAPGLYRQLFQAGTFPPHFHYFSRKSLDHLISRIGLKTEFTWDDRELDNLFHRIPSLSFLPFGGFAASIISLFPGDTRAACIRVSKK